MTTAVDTPDRLYERLPALYRIADAEKNGQLRALLRLIGSEADALRHDTEQLWTDFFIETCRRWVVPYIGDLVGNIPLHDLDPSAAAQTATSLFLDAETDRLQGPDLNPPGAIRVRADVANTIYYRRRKGTPPMLEELARDVTGWDARAVEFFHRLDWTQHLEHVRLECAGCPDIRRVDAGDRAGGPFDETTHTVDVRHINEWDGWYNIPNIGFFLWRLNAYRLAKVKPRAIGGTSWRLTFSPLGNNMPLFSRGSSQLGESGMATEITVETPIRAAAFFEDLARAAAAPVPPTTTDYYGSVDNQSLVVLANGSNVPATDVECTNLSGWSAFAQPVGTRILIDVTRGRLAIPTGRTGQTITVSYHQGFSADLGGGEYARRKWLGRELPGAPAPIAVTGGGNALDTAIAGRPPATRTIVRVGDNDSYNLSTNITLNAGESLIVEAEDGCRPHLRFAGGQLAVQGGDAKAALTFGGVLIEGALRITGNLGRLRLLHATLVPGRFIEQEAAPPSTGASLIVDPGSPGSLRNTSLEVEIAFAILGAIRVPAHISKLWLLDSVVQGLERAGGPTVAAVSDAVGTNGPAALIERSTLFGPTVFRKLDLGSESIFTGIVTVEQRQQGCVRFSYVPRGSRTPQQYRCQPSLEIATAKKQTEDEAAKNGTVLPPGWDVALENEIRAWLVPSFETDVYGRPEFAQLRRTCPLQVRTGAEDGSEMGAFSVLKQPQREANLRLRLDEYLPVGLEAGIVYVT